MAARPSSRSADPFAPPADSAPPSTGVAMGVTMKLVSLKLRQQDKRAVSQLRRDVHRLRGRLRALQSQGQYGFLAPGVGSVDVGTQTMASTAEASTAEASTATIVTGRRSASCMEV